MDRLILPLRPGMEHLLEALDTGRGATRLVGGAVRDALIGRPFNDVDLATRLVPDTVIRRLKAADIRVVPTGLAHGTVTAVLPTGPIEVTTLRHDLSTDGRRATVAYTLDWEADAARRDFTINALYADPIDGDVIDYFEGRRDLNAGIVRFIGDPLRRIAEDHLRILRFFRFHARYGRGEPDARSLEACTNRANDLMALSRERIADEVLKLLASRDPLPTVALMERLGILKPVLPEVTRRGVDRLADLMTAERSFGVPGDPIRRLAALLPDDAAVSVGQRLRLSKAQVRRLEQASGDAGAGTRALAYRLGTESAIDRLLMNGDDPQPLIGWSPPRLPITGGALIAQGLTEGPAVAAALRRVETRWIEEDFPPADRVEEIAADEVAQALASDR
ncbi:poly(A) polymerase [Sphingomonas jejuensis]|uniref:Poly(A) polymerase n=1 Tax=Sphingomonas jejuensis TaxID=904715 RepID=A0ABX0XLU6_9SPHN|nr:CCA tRNA nucleotidyltransferase [Sphingomonas jejuensis]NJC34348.1 poly(A) polymerase [Sphingomonas jejuensis]